MNKSIELDSGNASACNNRGNAYADKDDLDNAIKDYTKVTQLNPDYAQGYIRRAALWLYMKKWEKAKADFITAKNMGIDIIDALYNDYANAAEFEQKTSIQLPEDIAALLTPPQA